MTPEQRLRRAIHEAVARLREAAERVAADACPDTDGSGDREAWIASVHALYAHHAALAAPLEEIAADLEHAAREEG